jgi:hypothetical protein
MSDTWKDAFREAGWWLLILFAASLLVISLLAGAALIGHDLGWWN